MSKDNCALCSACKGIGKSYCDKCNAICCIENMKSHNEIFYLNNIFENKVNSALNDLISKSYEIINNLSKYYIYFSYNGNGIYECENFGDSLKNKYNDMNRENYELENKIEEEKIEFNRDNQNLANQHELNIEKIINDYNEAQEIIENTRIKDNKIKEEINTLKENKIELENEKKNINNINIDEIINNFIGEEKIKEENEFIINTNNIDKDNEVIDTKLEYTQEEIDLKNTYLNTINKIKNYSKKIPCFENWMQMYNLNKYINNQ